MSHEGMAADADRYCDDPSMTFREIAERLGTTHQAVMKVYHRAMKKLLKARRREGMRREK